jgi:hypothetical protein
MKEELRDALKDAAISDANKKKLREHFDRRPPLRTPSDIREFKKEVDAAIKAAADAEQAERPRLLRVQELEACFYGSLVPRDPSEGLARPKRAADGWRAGQSRPFVVKSITGPMRERLASHGFFLPENAREITVNVQHAPDRSTLLFEVLKDALELGEIT